MPEKPLRRPRIALAVDELYGDRQVRSDHPLLDRLTLRVVEIGVGWRASYDERDCEQPRAGG